MAVSVSPLSKEQLQTQSNMLLCVWRCLHCVSALLVQLHLCYPVIINLGPIQRELLRFVRSPMRGARVAVCIPAGSTRAAWLRIKAALPRASTDF